MDSPTSEQPWSLKAWLDSMFAWLLPRRPGLEADEGRARIQALLILVVTGACLISLVSSAATGAPPKLLAMIALTGAGYPPLLVWLRQGRLNRVAWAMVVWMVLAHSLTAWMQNGLYMLTLPYSISLPLIATILVGWRGGFAVSALIGGQIAFYWASGRADERTDPATLMVSAIAVLVLLTVVAAVYERQEARARTRLLKALNEKENSDTARTHSERNFRQIIEKAPDLILIHRHGVVLYANARIAAALGHPDARAIIGRPLKACFHPDEGPRIDERLRLYQQGTPPSAAELRMLRADGSVLHAEFNSFLANYEGAPALIGIGRDLSERRQLNARLAMADRMASVGTLAAGVAHELNNPLAFVTANLAYVRTELATGADPTPEQRDEWTQALDEAEDGARRMKSIIQDLKTYSRADETNVDTLEVAKVLRTTVRMAENEIRHRARLVLELAPDAFVRASEAKLGQVVLNLVVNAAQSIKAGDAEHHKVTVRSVVEGDKVRISVTDTGCGIAPEHLSRIFEPFFTTKAVGDGTGLGLFICHNLVNGMNGQIQAVSELGAGTTMTVVLPAEKPIESRPRPGDSTAPGNNRPKVLVVDDEPLVGRGVKRTLLGHDVTLTDNAAAALTLIREGHSYDAILCDLMMPEMDGAQFYAELEKLNPALLSKVLFLTAGAFTPDAQAFLESGKVWLAKPYESEVLRRAVRAVASGSRVLAA